MVSMNNSSPAAALRCNDTSSATLASDDSNASVGEGDKPDSAHANTNTSSDMEECCASASSPGRDSVKSSTESDGTECGAPSIGAADDDDDSESRQPVPRRCAAEQFGYGRDIAHMAQLVTGTFGADADSAPPFVAPVLIGREVMGIVGAYGKTYHCQRCLNHGVQVARKGHKRFCQFANCVCDKCVLVEQRKILNREINSEREKVNNSPNGDRADDLAIKMKSRNPKCARCGIHAKDVEPPPLKGHKKNCPYQNCTCRKCTLVTSRRGIMAKQIRLRRTQKAKNVPRHAEKNEHGRPLPLGHHHHQIARNFVLKKSNNNNDRSVVTPSSSISEAPMLDGPAKMASASALAAESLAASSYLHQLHQQHLLRQQPAPPVYPAPLAAAQLFSLVGALQPPQPPHLAALRSPLAAAPLPLDRDGGGPAGAYSLAALASLGLPRVMDAGERLRAAAPVVSQLPNQHRTAADGLTFSGAEPNLLFMALVHELLAAQAATRNCTASLAASNGFPTAAQTAAFLPLLYPPPAATAAAGLLLDPALMRAATGGTDLPFWPGLAPPPPSLSPVVDGHRAVAPLRHGLSSLMHGADSARLGFVGRPSGLAMADGMRI